MLIISAKGMVERKEKTNSEGNHKSTLKKTGRKGTIAIFAEERESGRREFRKGERYLSGLANENNPINRDHEIQKAAGERRTCEGKVGSHGKRPKTCNPKKKNRTTG